MIVTSPPTIHPGVWSQPQSSCTEPLQNIQTHSAVDGGEKELKAVSSELARLSHQGRWIVLINPKSQCYKSILAHSGVKMDRVLLVHTKDDIEALWALEKALTNGTSSAVICWTSSLDERDNRRLQLVNKSARAMGIVLLDKSHVEDVNHIQQTKLSFH